jgi:DNA-binding MarR family transcriptional regulator
MLRDVKKTEIVKPRLERLALIKSVVLGFRIRMDEELLPLGITTSQLRLLWTVEMNPLMSGAEVARMCSVTPQTGHAAMSRMVRQGLVRRKASSHSERVLIAELTASGRKVLVRATEMAEKLNREVWQGISERDLAVVERVLTVVEGRLGR